MKKDLRKYSNNLIVAGTGVMAFGIWNVIKSLMMAFLGVDDLRTELLKASVGSDINYLVIGYAVFSSVLIIGIVVRGYVGLNARAIGNGKRTPKRFIFISYVLLAAEIISIIGTYIMAWNAIRLSDADKLVTLAVDLTSVYALIEMLIAVRKVNEIRRLKGRP